MPLSRYIRVKLYSYRYNSYQVHVYTSDLCTIFMHRIWVQLDWLARTRSHASTVALKGNSLPERPEKRTAKLTTAIATAPFTA